MRNGFGKYTHQQELKQESNKSTRSPFFSPSPLPKRRCQCRGEQLPRPRFGDLAGPKTLNSTESSNILTVPEIYSRNAQTYQTWETGGTNMCVHVKEAARETNKSKTKYRKTMSNSIFPIVTMEQSLTLQK